MHTSTSRLYASAIAIVSGVYSLLAASGMEALGPSGVVMVALGVVVLVHGIVLLTPLAAPLGRVSGPAMIGWAVAMLGNHALLATMPAWGMGAGDRGGMAGPMGTAAGWDPGMVAVAALMLVSGLIMTFGNRAESGM